MNTEDRKSLALKNCINIALEYTEEEIDKFFPSCIQSAWQIGRDHIDADIEEDRKKLTGFTL